MKRDVDINEITDGCLYDKDSLVKINCNDCAGCDKCCHNMGESIILDPYDIYMLTKATGKSFEQLLSKEIALSVVDGIILPHINMVNNNLANWNEDEGECSFLKEGRCSIHDSRPGFCRLFPLGRLYKEDGTFDYINQINECPYEAKSKVKVKKWLDIPNISKYEAYIVSWHRLIKTIQRKMSDDERLKKYNMLLLQIMYVTPYAEEDFYGQFEERVCNLSL